MAMFNYLDTLYDQVPSFTLADALSEMRLLSDGTPADDACLADWERAIDKVFIQLNKD